MNDGEGHRPHQAEHVTQKMLSYRQRGESWFIMEQTTKESIGNVLLGEFLTAIDSVEAWDIEDREIFDYVRNRIKSDAHSKRTEFIYETAWLGFYLGFSSGMAFPEFLDTIAAKQNCEEVTA